MAERLVEDIFTALDEQTVVVPGTDAAALIVPGPAGSPTAVLDQRKLLAARIEELQRGRVPARVCMLTVAASTTRSRPDPTTWTAV